MWDMLRRLANCKAPSSGIAGTDPSSAFSQHLVGAEEIKMVGL